MPDESILKALKKAQISVDPAWLALTREEIIDPDLEIIDAHHHVWDMPGNRYLFDELLADFGSGHNIRASIYAQCRSMYRCTGPEEMRPVGETEFVNGIAAMSASGQYGDAAACAGIIGTTDLMLGDGVRRVLEAHIEAGGGRFRGIRPSVAWHESDKVRALDVQPQILMEPTARKAIAAISSHRLTLDLFCFFTQLDEVYDVAKYFPELRIIVNHTGGPLGIGPYEGRDAEVFAQLKTKLVALSGLPHTYVKLGGLGMRYTGIKANYDRPPSSSNELARRWGPYIQTAIDIFGPDRCMYESNFPVDKGVCSYHVLWNAFKKLSVSYTADERKLLFSATASKVYSLNWV